MLNIITDVSLLINYCLFKTFVLLDSILCKRKQLLNSMVNSSQFSKIFMSLYQILVSTNINQIHFTNLSLLSTGMLLTMVHKVATYNIYSPLTEISHDTICKLVLVLNYRSPVLIDHFPDKAIGQIIVTLFQRLTHFIVGTVQLLNRIWITSQAILTSSWFYSALYLRLKQFTTVS